MRRREFITLLGGAATWPIAGHAQQPDRMRLVGVLEGYFAQSNSAAQSNIAAPGYARQAGVDGRQDDLRIEFAGAPVTPMERAVRKRAGRSAT